MIATCDIEVEAGQSYLLTTTLQIDGPVAGFAPALLTCQCMNASGAALKIAPAGFMTSDVYGPHIHLKPVGVTGDFDVEQIITIPPGATVATFAVHRWRARDVRVINPIKIVSVAAPVEPASISKPDAMWQSEMSATVDETYEITATFSRPISARDIVAAVRFVNSQGHVCPPANPVAHSDGVGHFLYLTPTDGAAGFAKFRAPHGATTVFITLIRWANDKTLTLGDATVCARSMRDDHLASGKLAVQDSGWQVFRADVSVMGPQPILVDLVFLNADSTVIAGRTDGLKHDVQFDNFAKMSADPLSRHDGILPLHLAFLMPAGTQTIHWGIFLPDGGAHSMAGAPVLVDLPVQTTLAISPQGDPDLVHALVEQTLDIETPGYVARNGYDTLACLVSAVEPESWYTLNASLTRHAGGLHSASIILRATYFDDAKNRLDFEALAGFGHNPDLGHHSRLCLSVNDGSDGRTAGSSAPLCVPTGVTYAVFDIIAARPISGIEIAPLVLTQVTATRACRAFVPADMTKPQLVQALDLATLANDTVAAHAILSTLAIVDPQTKGYAYRARVLAQHLEIRAPDWMPETGPLQPYTPARNCIFHIWDHPVPDPTLMTQQALQGARPVLAASVTDHMPDTPSPAPYGVIQEKFPFPQTGWDGLSVSDRMALEARQHSKTCAAHRVELIHVTTDFKQIEALLKAVALARHHGLALVIEGIDLAGFPSPDDQVIIKRCLAAADRIIVSSRADQAIFRDCYGDIPTPDFIVRAVDPVFEFRIPKAKADALATHQALTGIMCIGYVCTTGAPDTILETALSAAGIQPMLVLIGSQDARNEQAQNLFRSGLSHLNIDIYDSDPRAWYRVFKAVIVPPETSTGKLIDTTLTAMSQGCPVIVPAGPDASDLAQIGHGSISVYNPNTANSLAKSLVQSVSTRSSHRPNPSYQNDAARLWADRISRYGASYAAAAAHQQKRHS